jgi:6-phosphogluconate dehydrogenase
MDLGMIGLGRMGGAMVRRLLKAGHRCVVHDVRREVVEALQREGAVGAFSLEELVRQLPVPRPVWMMLPAGLVDETLGKLVPLLQSGDTVIDGGNSYYHDDLRRAAELRQRGLHYVDVGVSGGVWGLERGYCLMIGGEQEPVRRLEPVFVALAPGAEGASRTPGREGPATPAEQGWLHCGPNGAGHFVKMVHNGIEYGLMAAYAEGLNILRHADVGMHRHVTDAETTPLRNPEEYRYAFDLPEVAELWRRGSVIGSWLLDLTAHALRGSPELSEFSGHVSDSGEGRWTLAAAIDEGVPAPVLGSALYQRFSSRGEGDFADRLLSAMRYQFGGHLEKGKGGG